MICATCGTENRAGRKFCSECASALAVICATCGAANQPGEKFCGECATPLTAAASAAPPRPAGSNGAPAPAIERRLVSVLFADLVGFTTLSEDRDPEAVREILSRYFDTAREIVDRYGGTLEKFIGDAVMAVWGAPIAREDDAERAVRAALDLTDAVATLGEQASLTDLRLRAGVMTGEAAVTVGAIGQGMVAGDLVNTASRLQSVAPPGSVLVGEATFRAASSAITFEAVGDQALKGKVLPVEAWRALRVVANRGGQGRTERLEAPFVGRAEEFRILKDMFHVTEREGRMRLVSVTGIGGIGKSRLAWEFEKYIDGVLGTVYWHQGRCPAYGEGITFWALGEMVRGRARILEGEEPDAARQKLVAMLEEWVADEDERRWLEPRLATLLGLEAGAPGEREELFAAWRALFEHISERAPAVLVFEDLQWADAGLLDFIESMVEWSRSRPILIVTLARPELLEKRPTWGAGQRNFVGLHLEPLSDDAMTELLAGLAPGLPDQLVRDILRRAEGTPLYAVETVRMLVDDGKLVSDGDSYRLTAPLERLEVPATLQSLISARLDGLPPDMRTLLQTASVLGQSFTIAALAALSGEETTTLEPRLRELVRRELVAVELDPRSPERGQYHFVQGIIREVVYNTLSRADRRTRHVAAARYFETIGDDELAGVLASHYLAAYRTDPEGAEAAALAAQARIALRGAAERARALHSYGQAVTYLEQALEVAADDLERAEIHHRLAISSEDADRMRDAEDHLRAAIDAARAAGDRNLAARATARLGHVLMLQSRIAEARGLLEPALVELEGTQTDAEVVQLMSQLARASMFRGEPVDAMGWLERALPIAESLELSELVVELLATKGWAVLTLGRPQEGVALLRGAVALADSLAYSAGRLRGRINLSALLFNWDPVAGLAVAREGVDIATRYGLVAPYGMVLFGNAAAAAFLAGEWDWILEVEPRFAVDMHSDEVRGGMGAAPAALRAFRGQLDAALETLAPLSRIAERSDSYQDAAEANVGSAQVALAAGDLAAAFQHGIDAALPESTATFVGLMTAARAAAWTRDAAGLREVIRIVRDTPLHGAVYRAVQREAEAAVTALDGNLDHAAAQFAQATDTWRALRLAPVAAMCQVSQIATLGPDHPSSASAAAEARATFESLKSPPMIERLDALLGAAMNAHTPQTVAREAAESVTR
ncbi:MAG: AAA family ATPase [Chloroflexota bacterium]|nr:AAA family ATPase [Chloroflexota bacterium]